MPPSHWTYEDIPDQRGRVALVTGGNSGLGYYTCRGLAAKGAHVLLACRNHEKGEAARRQMLADAPAATIELVHLDLADLESVRRCAEDLSARLSRLDLLINNAGVMALPYTRTAQGFEMQFGVNHLAHFALTGLLLPLLLATPNSRVVTVSSSVHHQGKINFDDLNGERSYNKWRAYAQSKLANLLFAFELQRKLDAAHAETLSVAAHPGYAATNLQTAGPRMAGSKLQEWFMALLNALLAQPAEQGALPQLYAATAGDVNGCDYIGPRGFREMRGSPAKVAANPKAHDKETARRLWAVSQDLTGVDF